MAQAARINQCKEAFRSAYGVAASGAVRCPGRVNLIGEHVDYSGFSVLPMCVDQDVLVLYAHNPDTTVLTSRVVNMDAAFAPLSFARDFEPSTIDASRHAWTNYFLAGYGSFLQHARVRGRPLLFLVHGTVPKGAGLSSSSALVCAAVLATMAAHGLSLPRTELAELACQAERHVGTMGGGMDQAICLLGAQGTAKLIHFFPLRADDVPLPRAALFVVMHSRVDSLKAAAARPFHATYNMRVVECRLAAAALAHHLRLAAPPADAPPRRLAQVMHEAGRSLPDMLALTASVLPPGGLDRGAVAALVGLSAAELDARFMQRVPPDVRHFHLQQRARHVFSESARVFAFRDACAGPEASVEALGALMTASHASLRDDFAASVPELDALVAAALAAGALGARLTGAGWGGCAVALVPDARLPAFLAAMRAQFYADVAPAALPDLLFVTAPAAAAAILDHI